MKNEELENRLTLSRALFKWGRYQVRERERKLEFIKSIFYFNDQTKCILRTT